METDRFIKLMNIVSIKAKSHQLVSKFLSGDVDLLITSDVRLDYLSKVGKFFYDIFEELGGFERNPSRYFSPAIMRFLDTHEVDYVLVRFDLYHETLVAHTSINITDPDAIQIEDIFDELGIRKREDFLALL